MIYADYNAGAPLTAKVAAHLQTAFDGLTGNPSSVHAAGRASRKRLDAARVRVAQALGATPREVSFVGSGSEAAAIAIIGAFWARKDAARTRVVTTAVEHPCVLGAVKRLEALGADVARLPVGADGRVALDVALAALTAQTALCTVQWVNNETGVVQPVAELSRACAGKGVVFHCDAVQAFGRVPASLREVPADLLSLSAHKLGGPAGVGALYGRRGVDVAALTPGHQENGRRGGTQSVALAEALAIALEDALASQEAEAARLGALRDGFEAAVTSRLERVRVNGGAAPRVPNTSNLCFEGADGEALLIALDLDGICASSGAACASGSQTPSHVLRAMGLSPADVHGSLRFSFGAGTTPAEVEAVVEALVKHLPAAREAAKA